jgi:hypothetical protein
LKNKTPQSFQECYESREVNVSRKMISNKDYKKIIDDLAEIFYDYYCQRQKDQSCLSNELSKPQQEVA